MEQQESASKLEDQVGNLKKKKGSKDVRMINKGSEHVPVSPGAHLGIIEYAIEIGHERLKNPQEKSVEVVQEDLSLTHPGHFMISDKRRSPINR